MTGITRQQFGGSGTGDRGAPAWRRSLKRVLLWTVAAGLAFAVAVLLFLYFSPSYHAYIVQSESMKPTLAVGDMIIVGPPNGFFSHRIAPGQIVTFRLGDDLVTHRVQSFDGKTLVTKGDAVEEADPQPVALSQVVGVEIFTIPKIGLLSAFMRTKLAWLLVIGVIAGGFVAIMVKGWSRSTSEGPESPFDGTKTMDGANGTGDSSFTPHWSIVANRESRGDFYGA